MRSLFILLFFLGFGLQSLANEPIRLKDLVSVKGVRDNPIIGYGLVVGLDGTGDGGGEITNTALTRMFQQLGLNPQNEVSSNNVASVIVTAKLPPFARVGQKIDVTVSSIGGASSLAGGTLLVTPLKGGDDNVYAITSGPISIGGLEGGQRFTTTATIPGGATVEREIEVNFDRKESLRLSLHNPDFTTAARVEQVINSELGGRFASARDAGTLDLIIPTHYQRSVVQLMALIENFKVHTDERARIVINERTGTIVAGGGVRLRPVAISHGDLTINIGNQDGGNDQAEGSLIYMEAQPTLNDLVQSLNAFGANPDDIISIFQALRSNGSLIGEIEMI